MSDVGTQQQTATGTGVAAQTKKGATAPGGASSGSVKKTKNPRSKPTHPPTSEMVNGAIKSLKERGGSSLQAIKKYVAANYKVDAEKMSPFIKKYLKAAVASGALVQTKGKGASGSFKLATAKKSAGEAQPVGGATGKTASGSKKKSPVKAKGKRTAGAGAASAATTGATEKKQKLKKTTKSPTKKPKVPKPKTAKKASSGGAASAPKSSRSSAGSAPSRAKARATKTASSTNAPRSPKGGARAGNAASKAANTTRTAKGGSSKKK